MLYNMLNGKHVTALPGESESRVDEQLPEFGGYTEVARVLTARGPRAVTRQGVRAWWMKREANGFPEAVQYTREGWKLFRIAEIMAWYEQYVPSRLAHWGGRNRNK